MNNKFKIEVNLTLYRITSDIFGSCDEDFVVAKDLDEAINTYVERYAERNMTKANIVSIERISEKCLISGK